MADKPKAVIIAFVAFLAANSSFGQTYTVASSIRGVGELAAVSPDGRRLALSLMGDRGRITFWDLEHNAKDARGPTHNSAIRCLVFAPSGKFLVFGTGYMVKDKPIEGQGKLFVLSANEGIPIGILSQGEFDFDRVCVSFDDKLVAAVCRGGAVRVWRLDTQELAATLTGYDCAFSSKKILAVASDPKGGCTLYDCENFRATKSFRLGDDRNRRIAFSPDGATLVAANVDNTIRVFKLTADKITAELKGHTDLVNSLAFSNDGRILVSASFDKTVRVWDMNSYQEITTLRGHDREVLCVSVFGEDNAIMSAGLDRVVKIWKKK